MDSTREKVIEALLIIMKLNDTVIDLLSKKAGRDVTTPYGADYLRNDIEVFTGESLSLNTVKRLVGILPYESFPRAVTLNIISNYLGFSSWQLLQEYLSGKISDFDISEGFIDLTNQSPGKIIKIRWQPDRCLSIKHIGHGKYVVIQSINSKLHTEDLLYVSQIAVGFPFMVKMVERKGVNLGNYIAAKKTGIDAIEIERGRHDGE